MSTISHKDSRVGSRHIHTCTPPVSLNADAIHQRPTPTQIIVLWIENEMFSMWRFIISLVRPLAALVTQ